MDKGRNIGGVAHQVFYWYTGVYLELDLQTTLHHPMMLLVSFPWRKLYHCPMHYEEQVYGGWECYGVTQVLVHWRKFCFLQTGLLTLVLECWGLTGLSSLKLVNTKQCWVKLQHMYLHDKVSLCCTGVVGDWPKCEGSKDKSYLVETW